jgi:hypothetical protein
MSHINLFRLADFETMLIGTEHFVDTVRYLELDAIDCRELPALRGAPKESTSRASLVPRAISRMHWAKRCWEPG